MSPNVPALDPCIGCRDLESGPRCIGSDGYRDYHALAAAYLKSPVADKNAPAIPHRDAFDCVFSMTSDSPEEALAFVFVALEHAVTAKRGSFQGTLLSNLTNARRLALSASCLNQN